MPVNTHIDQARTRVQAEQDAVDAKIDAFETFTDQVADLPTDQTPSMSAVGMATVGAQLHATSSHDDQCRGVRTAFAETIQPHSVADVDGSEPLLETIREEFTDTIAVALAPTTETAFTADLKQMVIAEAQSRTAEATALHQALEREAATLDEASETVATITAWIAEADETSLTDLGFDALRDRHETLGTHRERCEDLAADRQAFLDETTSAGVDAGIRHRSLIPYLYPDFPVDHPVLATVARLAETCDECQRVVRQHLVRRA